MTTCRELLTDVLETFQGLAPGDSLHVDEIASGMKSIQWLVLQLHEGRGPMVDVDVAADYIAGANQRLRVQDGDTVTITLPNSVPLCVYWRLYDFDFSGAVHYPQQGSLASADGSCYRQPRDGERIEIVGLNAQALYFYRSDINTWVQVNALGIDDPMPLNGVYLHDAAAILANRLCGRWPSREIQTPTAQMLRDEARARGRLFGRPGVARDPVVAQYF